MQSSEEKIMEKYASKLFNKDGTYNLNTVKQIALDSGLEKADIVRSFFGSLVSINGEWLRPDGIDPKRKVESIYNFCVSKK
jgi:hypothetical protein